MTPPSDTPATGPTTGEVHVHVEAPNGKQGKNWVGIVGVAIGALTLVGGTVAAYVSTASTASAHYKVDDDRDSVASHKIEKMDLRQQRMDLNIILIGERVRAPVKRGDE